MDQREWKRTRRAWFKRKARLREDRHATTRRDPTIDLHGDLAFIDERHVRDRWFAALRHTTELNLLRRDAHAWPRGVRVFVLADAAAEPDPELALVPSSPDERADAPAEPDFASSSLPRTLK
jgi:hypothetical protein